MRNKADPPKTYCIDWNERMTDSSGPMDSALGASEPRLWEPTAVRRCTSVIDMQLVTWYYVITTSINSRLNETRTCSFVCL